MKVLLRSLLFLALLAVLPLLPQAPGAHAQDAPEPQMRITRIDERNFPDVKVYIQGRNMGSEFPDTPLTLQEDEREVDDVTRSNEEVGTQTVFLLDASGSILDPGPTGQPRYIEVGDVARRFIELNLLSLEYDWLAAYAPQEDGSVGELTGWTRDHQAVVNSLTTYQPSPDVTRETPLADLIFFTLNNLQNEDAPEHTIKAIVLFSDGVIGPSDLKLDDAVRQAADRNVVLHSVLLGPITEEGERNMRRLALLTGGQFLHLNAVEALDGLWQGVVAERSQRVLEYRSTVAEPRQLLVAARLENGTLVRTAAPFPPVNAAPPVLTVVEPATEEQITKEAPAFDTPLQELDPQSLDVKVEIEWPDGRERELSQVEYTLHTETVLRTEPPFDEATFPIAQLGNGRYTLRVTATDELGVQARSEPRTIEVNVVRPPEPPPPVQGIRLGNTVIPWTTITPTLSLLGVALAATALLIAWRKPSVRERVVDAVGVVAKAVTEPFMFSRNDALKGTEIKGRLTVQDRGRAASLPPHFDLRGGTTRIGRAAEYANMVIDEPRVSRLHCRIAEDAEGNLCLYDEGGTSGTFVNFNPVSMDGHMLQSNDIVNVGPVQMLFQYMRDVHEGQVSGATSYPTSKEVTEPAYTPPR